MDEQIREEIKQISYLIERSPKNNEYTLALTKNNEKQYVLSKYIPKQSALKILGEEWGNKSTVWVLFGFGFGYMLDKIIEVVGLDTRILIIEPDEELLQKQVTIYQVERLARLKNVKVISSQELVREMDILKEFIPTTEFSNINIRCLDKYLEYYKEFISVVLMEIKKIRNRLIINFNTILTNQREYIRNTIRNRHGFKECHDLNYHRGKYQGVPALIVGAGPSLANNLYEIKNFKGIVFAMGRTLTPIIEHGIIPDFVCSVDSSDMIYDTFNKYKEHDIPLIALTDSNYKVVEGSHGPKYFIGNNQVTSGLLEVRVNPTLDVYVSVSSLCLSTATYMGCNPIIFIGQDLAYKDRRKHSDLALVDNQDKSKDLVTSYMELLSVKGYYGEVVETGVVWQSLIKWIEDFIEEKNRDKKTIYINSTEGGAYIEGALHLSLKETIKQYCTNEKPIISHVLLNESDNIDVDKQLESGLRRLRNIFRGLRLGKAYHERLVNQYNNHNGEKKEKIQELLKKIQRVDQIIINIEGANKLIKILMERVELVLSTSNTSKEPIDETENQRRLRACRLNYETYEALMAECERLINLIEGELEE